MSGYIMVVHINFVSSISLEVFALTWAENGSFPLMCGGMFALTWAENGNFPLE